MIVNKFKHRVSAQRVNLDEVRQWEYGVLLLTVEEGRGVDTRFRKDARVLITCTVDSYHDLQQMMGRSSRSRGVCDGVLYLMGDEKPMQYMERIRRQNAADLQELEKVFKLVEYRRKDQTLLKNLKEEKVQGRQVRTLNHL